MTEYEIESDGGDKFIHRFRSIYQTKTFILPFKERIDSFDSCVCCRKTKIYTGSLVCKNCRNDNVVLKAELLQARKMLSSGYTSPSVLKEVKDKKKATTIKNYGVENPSQSAEVKLKKKATVVKNWGVENPSQSQEIKEKKIASAIDKYGVTHHLKVPEIVEARKATCLALYGHVAPGGSEEVKAKMKATVIERYGVEYASMIESAKEKTKDTWLKNWEGGHPTRDFRYQERMKESWNERYGVDHPFKSETVKEKMRTTSLANWGVENPMQSETVVERMKDSNSMSRHGYSHQELKEKWIKCYQECGLVEAIKSFPTVSMQIIWKRFLTDEQKRRHCSVPQQFVKDFIEGSIGLKFEVDAKSIIPENKRLEIDLIDSTSKASIEFNGIFWHQIHLGGKFDADIKKAERMRELGYAHLVLDETDIPKLDKITRLLTPISRRIHARKCEVRKVEADVERAFLDEFHMQGYTASSEAYGLFFGNELVQVMTFVKSRFDKSFEWEILRLASKTGVAAVGGSSKLFKNFLTEIEPTSVVSYSDIKYFSGSVYSSLGFKYAGNTPRGYVWFKYGKVLSRYQTQKHKLKNLLEKFDPDLSESENMQMNGWIKSEDLGHKKWIMVR
jgi:hypothetical protein